MRVILMLAALASAGCGAGGLAIANGAALGAASTTLACDWHGTRATAERGWVTPDGRFGQHESNRVIQAMGGPKPEPGVIDMYFLGAFALSALGWYVVPKRYRIAVPLIVTAVSVKASINNVINDAGFCGF